MGRWRGGAHRVGPAAMGPGGFPVGAQSIAECESYSVSSAPSPSEVGRWFDNPVSRRQALALSFLPISVGIVVTSPAAPFQ